MIQQLETQQESRIIESHYPLAVKEFAERNAPEVKPPQINKQGKEKHPRHQDESHAEATWRAWEMTANNPTGKVANAGMALQALALEIQYAPVEEKESLLRQVSEHFADVLSKVANGDLSIPDDSWLTEQNFSPFYEEQIEAIAEASTQLSEIEDSQEQIQFTDKVLQRTSELLFDIANGPNALNLQTAVDTAKSAKGIDENLHQFVAALQYKEDVSRQYKNDSSVYTGGATMPTNIIGPVYEGIKITNERYEESYEKLSIESRRHVDFSAIFPKITKEQTAWAEGIKKESNKLIKKALESRARQNQKRPEDSKPTLRITVPDGRQLVLQNIGDDKGTLPIWRGDSAQPDWEIRISQESKFKSSKNRFPAELKFTDSQGHTCIQRVGFVSPESAAEHNLKGKLGKQQGKPLTVSNFQIETRVPHAQQNDYRSLFEQEKKYIEAILKPPPGRDKEKYRQKVANILWRGKGQHIVYKYLPKFLCDRLKQVPLITVNRLQVQGEVIQKLIAQGHHTVRFGQDTFQNKAGEAVTECSVSVMQPDRQQLLIGAANRESLKMPEGGTYRAEFSENPTSKKVIDVQVIEMPVVEQTPAEITAMHEGRRHLTMNVEPYTTYGIREGAIMLAQAAPEGEQIALRVGGQHVITRDLLEKAGQRWAEVEKAPPEKLAKTLDAAASKGNTVWGLNATPMGTYQKGQITPFPETEIAIARAKEIAPTVRLAYEKMPREGNSIETKFYRVTEQDDGTLVLASKDGELARFNPQNNDEVISVTKLETVDLQRWEKAKDILEKPPATIQRESTGQER